MSQTAKKSRGDDKTAGRWWQVTHGKMGKFWREYKGEKEKKRKILKTSERRGKE